MVGSGRITGLVGLRLHKRRPVGGDTDGQTDGLDFGLLPTVVVVVVCSIVRLFVSSSVRLFVLFG